MAPERSIVPARTRPLIGRTDPRLRSSPGKSENAQKKTGKHDLKAEREEDNSGNHDAQCRFHVERAELADAPVLEAKRPKSGSGQNQHDASDQSGLEPAQTAPPGRA